MTCWQDSLPGLGECCCNCQYRLEDYSHATTDGGRVTRLRGYICSPPLLPKKSFSGWTEHGGCEMWSLREGENLPFDSIRKNDRKEEMDEWPPGFEEAVTKLANRFPCDACNGTGLFDGDQMTNDPCERCGGTGRTFPAPGVNLPPPNPPPKVQSDD